MPDATREPATPATATDNGNGTGTGTAGRSHRSHRSGRGRLALIVAGIAVVTVVVVAVFALTRGSGGPDRALGESAEAGGLRMTVSSAEPGTHAAVQFQVAVEATKDGAMCPGYGDTGVADLYFVRGGSPTGAHLPLACEVLNDGEHWVSKPYPLGFHDQATTLVWTVNGKVAGRWALDDLSPALRK